MDNNKNIDEIIQDEKKYNKAKKKIQKRNKREVRRKEIAKSIKKLIVIFKKILPLILTISISSTAYLVHKKNKSDNSKQLLNNCTIETVLNEQDFKVSKDSTNFIELLENYHFNVDDLVKESDGLDEIYSMYECVWGIENATEQEDKKLYQDEINNILPNFISSLKNLISTRVPGILDEVKIDSITSSKTEQVITKVEEINTSTLKDNSYKNIKKVYYDDEGNIIENSTSTSDNFDYILSKNENSVYNIKITDKDILVLMDAIKNEKTKDYFSTNTIKKIVSAAIRVSCKDYIMTYDTKKQSINAKIDEPTTIYTGELRQNYQYIIDDKIEETLNNLKNYLIRYYKITSKVEEVKITTINDTWYFIDNTGKKYELEDNIVQLCRAITFCQNQSEELLMKNEEDVISIEQWQSYNDLESLNEINKKIKLRK